MKFVVYTTLNHTYLKLGAALISSIWMNSDTNIEIRILNTGLKKRDILKLKKWAIKENRYLQIININYELFSKYIQLPKSLFPEISFYARLIIPYITDIDENLILYLDADIVCISDFSKIFSFNLYDHIVACCRDKHFPNFSSKISEKSNFKVVNNYHELGFTGSEPYINSGVLLINPQKWISNNLSEKIINKTLENKSNVFLWDQYAMNIVLVDKWIELPEEWNETNNIKNSKTKFRHFIKIKPTNYRFNFADKEIFFKYLDHSPWKGWRPTAIHYFFDKIIKYSRKKVKRMLN